MTDKLYRCGQRPHLRVPAPVPPATRGAPGRTPGGQRPVLPALIAGRTRPWPFHGLRLRRSAAGPRARDRGTARSPGAGCM